MLMWLDELPLTNIPTLDDVPNAIPSKPDDVDAEVLVAKFQAVCDR
jgi:hypothetical protein